MIAHDRTVEEVAAELGADSLAYLSLDGVYEAVGTPREVHCDACFTGEYPLGDDGEANGKFALEGLPVVQGAGWGELSAGRRSSTGERASSPRRCATTSATRPSGRGSWRRSRPRSRAATCSW